MSGGFFFLNNKQQLEYLLRIRKIREVMVVKDNIHLTYKYKNRNQAFKQVENLQDKIINHVIDDVLFGNVGELKNIEKTTSKIINDTLVNERKRIHRIDDRFVNHAVKSNAEIFSGFFNNRLNNIKYSLQLRIEEELRKNSIRNLSDSEIRKILSEKYADTGKARLKNIVKDSIHTNESNISFIQALNEGYSYKVWMNGRSKGKTRPWHRARIIASVPIDEYFDIYGSYHAELMYPGDLNGGAENVANCKCWLRYTNRTPSNLKNKSSFNIHPNSYLYGKNNGGIKQNALKVTSKIGNKITRTISNIGSKLIKSISWGTNRFKKYNRAKQVNNNGNDNNIFPKTRREVENKLKKELSNIFSDETIKLIVTEWEKRIGAEIEHGHVFNYVSGKLVGNPLKGGANSITILRPNTFEGNLAAFHNHTKKGFNAPSGEDFEVCMGNNWLDYFIALSSHEIWVIKAKGYFPNELINELSLKINSGLVSIKFEVKCDEGIPSQEKINVMNKRASEFVKNYISENKQYDIEVYQVVL